jgi:hypothetical protein
LNEQIVSCDPGIGDQNIELPHDLLSTWHQRLGLGRIGKIGGQYMHALGELGSEFVKNFAPRSRNCDCRALTVQATRYRGPDRAGRSSHQRCLSGEVEHVSTLTYYRAEQWLNPGRL